MRHTTRPLVVLAVLAGLSASLPLAGQVPGRAAGAEPATLHYLRSVGGPAYGVALMGQLALVGMGRSVLAVDRSNPSAPTVTGESDELPDTVQAIAANGSHAYVAHRFGGLAVLDFSHPELPRLAGRLDTAGEAVDVVVVGTRAYVADGNDGLVIVDVSDAGAPRRVGHLDTPEYANGIAVQGPFAFVADMSGGLLIVDIADETAPRPLATQTTPGRAWGVAVANGIAYVACDTAGLYLVDVANVAAPKEITVQRLAGPALGVAVAGQLAYVASNLAGLSIVDVANPKRPTLVRALPMGDSNPQVAVRVMVSGEQAFVAIEDAGLSIVSVTPPTGARVLAEVGTIGSVEDVAAAAGRAYFAAGRAGVWLVGPRALSPAPRLVHNLRPAGQAAAVAAEGGRLAVSGSSLQLFDSSNPDQPLPQGAVADQHPAGIALAGDFAFLADRYNRIWTVDIADPNSPRVVAQLAFPVDKEAWPDEIVVGHDHAFVAGLFGGVRVLNVATPTAPVEVGHYDTNQRQPDGGNGSYASSVALGWPYLYVAAQQLGLLVLDVSDPTKPRRVGAFDSPGRAYDVAVYGSHVILGDGPGGVRVVDVADPTRPHEVAAFQTTSDVEAIAVDQGLIYAALREQGGLVLRLTLPGGEPSPAPSNTRPTPIEPTLTPAATATATGPTPTASATAPISPTPSRRPAYLPWAMQTLP